MLSGKEELRLGCSGSERLEDELFGGRWTWERWASRWCLI